MSLFIKKNKIKKFVFFIKMCVGSTFINVDPTIFSTFLGYRKYNLFLANSVFLEFNLKISLQLLEFFARSGYTLFFIFNTQSFVSFQKFRYSLKSSNFSLLRCSEIGSGFLTNKNSKDIIVVTLFLEQKKLDLIKKECFFLRVPLICFNSFNLNKNSILLNVSANYESFFSKNLILSLLSISLFSTK